jgi:hypothetical protein
LSAIVGATDAGRLVGFGPRPFSRPNQTSSIAYVDANKRIQVLTLNNGAWSIADLSANTGTTTNVVVPYIRSDDVGAYLYINTDGHIREHVVPLLLDADITAQSGAPAPLNPFNGIGSVLNAYVRADRLTTVVYQATNNHIIELARTGAGTWVWNDITNAVGTL